MINLKGLTPGMLMTLGDQKILTLEDFADLASDELTGGFDIVNFVFFSIAHHSIFVDNISRRHNQFICFFF